MNMRNNKRCNVLTHARVTFSQSETGSLQRGGELNFELLLWGELTEKILIFDSIFCLESSGSVFESFQGPMFFYCCAH